MLPRLLFMSHKENMQVYKHLHSSGMLLKCQVGLKHFNVTGDTQSSSNCKYIRQSALSTCPFLHKETDFYVLARASKPSKYWCTNQNYSIHSLTSLAQEIFLLFLSSKTGCYIIQRKMTSTIKITTIVQLSNYWGCISFVLGNWNIMLYC